MYLINRFFFFVLGNFGVINTAKLQKHYKLIGDFVNYSR